MAQANRYMMRGAGGAIVARLKYWTDPAWPRPGDGRAADDDAAANAVPDFTRIAFALAEQHAAGEAAVELATAVAGLLRKAWNGRGEVDYKATATILTTLMGTTAAEPYLSHVHRAFDDLNR